MAAGTQTARLAIRPAIVCSMISIGWRGTHLLVGAVTSLPCRTGEGGERLGLGDHALGCSCLLCCKAGDAGSEHAALFIYTQEKLVSTKNISSLPVAAVIEKSSHFFGLHS